MAEPDAGRDPGLFRLVFGQPARLMRVRLPGGRVLDTLVEAPGTVNPRRCGTSPPRVPVGGSPDSPEAVPLAGLEVHEDDLPPRPFDDAASVLSRSRVPARLSSMSVIGGMDLYLGNWLYLLVGGDKRYCIDHFRQDGGGLDRIYQSRRFDREKAVDIVRSFLVREVLES